MSSSNKPSKQGTWTIESYRALSIALFSTMGPFPPEKQEAIVQDMEARGAASTWEAIRQHLQKLKRKDKDGAGAGANGSAGSVPSTPKKGAKGGAAKNGGGSRSTTGGRKRTTRPDPVDFESAANDDDDEPDTPARKKVKATPAPANKGQLEEDEPAPPADGEEI